MKLIYLGICETFNFKLKSYIFVLNKNKLISIEIVFKNLKLEKVYCQINFEIN